MKKAGNRAAEGVSRKGSISRSRGERGDCLLGGCNQDLRNGSHPRALVAAGNLVAASKIRDLVFLLAFFASLRDLYPCLCENRLCALRLRPAVGHAKREAITRMTSRSYLPVAMRQAASCLVSVLALLQQPSPERHIGLDTVGCHELLNDVVIDVLLQEHRTVIRELYVHTA